MASNGTTIGIVIPFPRWDDWTAECVAACAAQTYSEIEIWLLPDEPMPPDQEAQARRLAGHRPLRIEATGRANPARKRNVALRQMTCAWVALVDADAYPPPDWLQRALAEMRPGVGIVAGPNLTPPGDPLARQLSGLVMRSPLGFGPGYIRHHPVARHEVEEMPTCNMLLRRLPDLFFREEFDTAEDMMYCQDVRARGLKIIYAPTVVVYHHRRRFPAGLARQFFYYGKDKGRLWARGHTSSRLAHAMPALLLLYALALAVLAGWLSPLPLVAWLPAGAYAALVLLESIRSAVAPAIALGGLLAFPLAHASYGWGYLCGLPAGWRERNKATSPETPSC